MKQSRVFKIWILSQVMLVSAGWILSAFGALNCAGYLSFFLVAGVVLVIWRRYRAPDWQFSRKLLRRQATRCRHRFRRAFPLLFLLGLAGAFLAGAIHPPSNRDALAYRLPRMLDWWMHSGWHWISTSDERMNYSAANFEWLTLPLLVLLRSDRFLFLVNIVSYAMMPSLLFVVFVGLGVSRRAAWAWMWLLPMGFCYLLQSGSIANDIAGAVLILASIHFALLARRTRRDVDLGFAFLAAALATGIKAVNLPLLLPVACALVPALRVVRWRLPTAALTFLFSLLVSFVPIAVFNQLHTGNWQGGSLVIQNQRMQRPLIGVVGNFLELGSQALMPPVVPAADKVAAWLSNKLPSSLQQDFARDFPRFQFTIKSVPHEASAGLGLGVTLLVLAGMLAGGFREVERADPRRRLGWVIAASAWMALVVYSAKVANEQPARLIAAYYPLLITALLLLPPVAGVVRTKWWLWLGIFSGIASLLCLTLNPSQPLWPADRILSALVGRYPNNLALAHLRHGYIVSEGRDNLLAPLRRLVPEDVKVIGVVDGLEDARSALWKPYGSKQVCYLTSSDLERPQKLEWLIIQKDELEELTHRSFSKWLEEVGGTVVAQELIPSVMSPNLLTWSIVRIDPSS